MNRLKQEKTDKEKKIPKSRKRVRSAEEVLKQALTECMQEEADQAREKMKLEGQHAFSKSFIEKMQFVIKQGKTAEEQQKKKVRGRRLGRVAAACIVCVVAAGGSWVGLRGSFNMEQNDTSGSGARTEQSQAESVQNPGERKEDFAIGREDTVQNETGSAETADSSKSENQENKNSQESVNTEENTSTAAEESAQNIDVKVLAVTSTSLKVRLTNNGEEEISFGDEFESLEIYDATTDTWTECQKKDEITYHDILHVVKPGNKQNWYDWSTDWSEAYGSLKPGHYRMWKNISIGNLDGGDQYVQQVQIEFDVE